MREIKFRVWCKNYNEWEEDLIVILSSGALMHRNVTIDSSDKDKPCSPQTHIVQFYTNLKDKNSKEIFEGDIVKRINTDYTSTSGGMETIHEIYFVGGMFAMAEKVMPSFDNPKGIAGFPLGYCKDIEIIGNIYENPELLEDTP